MYYYFCISANCDELLEENDVVKLLNLHQRKFDYCIEVNN
jgi:hypothetical protein